MEPSLITTKLHVPPARPGLVSRPRLAERLAACSGYTLTLLSAPAGFGKTTLLSEWIRHSQPPLPFAWFSIEGTENDPIRFWDYLIAALKTVQPAIGETSLALLRSPQSLPIQSVLTPLINEIAGIPKDFVLVLDDYHFIQSQPVHDGLTFLLDHLPPRMHLIIASRVDPPLPLTHLRGKGTMLEIGADDLRFTQEEAASLLKELKAPALSRENINALNARAEGWVVGLKMAMLSLKDEKDIPGFLASFTGTQRYVMDYLLEEVLQWQTPGVRDFLLKTSILDRLSGPLCDAVTGRNDGRETLIGLDKANLFIVPLDASREWYRYEHLFAELLQHRLEQELGNEAEAELRKRASRWLEGNGFPESAIDHALAAKDWHKAIDLIMSLNPLPVYGGSTTYNWLRKVPREVLLPQPMAYITYAWSLVFITRYKEGSEMLDSYEKSAAYDPEHAGLIAALRTNIAAYLGDPGIEEYAKKALSLPSPDLPPVRNITSLHLGVYYVRTRRVNEAEPLLNEAYQSSLQRNDNFISAAALLWLAIIELVRGKLHRAEEMFKRAIGTTPWHPHLALAHLYLGAVYSEWNEQEAAIAEREKAMKMLPVPAITVRGHLWTSGTRMMQGDIAAAAAEIEKAERVLTGGDAGIEERACVAGFQAALAAAQDDHESAARWLDRLAEYEGADIFDLSVKVRYLLHRRWGEAMQARLQAQYEWLRQEGLVFFLIGTRIEQALAADDPDEALAFLAEALAMGRPEGFIGSFLQCGILLAPLLRRAVSRRIEPEYARKLLDLIEAQERQRRIRKGEIPAMVSPPGLLSGRELEVLRLLADGLSNRQIADKLVVSLNTAKTHIHNITQKLEADSRTRAIARARELKLI